MIYCWPTVSDAGPTIRFQLLVFVISDYHNYQTMSAENSNATSRIQWLENNRAGHDSNRNSFLIVGVYRVCLLQGVPVVER